MGRLRTIPFPCKEFFFVYCSSKYEVHEILSFPPLTHALTHTGKYACDSTRETSAVLMLQPLQKG